MCRLLTRVEQLLRSFGLTLGQHGVNAKGKYLGGVQLTLLVSTMRVSRVDCPAGRLVLFATLPEADTVAPATGELADTFRPVTADAPALRIEAKAVNVLGPGRMRATMLSVVLQRLEARGPAGVGQRSRQSKLAGQCFTIKQSTPAACNTRLSCGSAGMRTARQDAQPRQRRTG